MRGIQSLGAVLAFIASIFFFRIVLHGYTDHGQLDVFHLVVAASSLIIGMLLLRRAFPSRS